jgi:hypothetical protein
MYCIELWTASDEISGRLAVETTNIDKRFIAWHQVKKGLKVLVRLILSERLYPIRISAKAKVQNTV